MNQKQNEDLNAMIDEFLNELKETMIVATITWELQSCKVNPCKLFCGKKEASSQIIKKRQLFENIRALNTSIYNFFVWNHVSYPTITFHTLMF